MTDRERLRELALRDDETIPPARALIFRDAILALLADLEAAEERLAKAESVQRCIFKPCVATWRHWHGGFPGGYDNPADPEGPPIEFTSSDPDPSAVRDYNGAALAAIVPEDAVVDEEHSLALAALNEAIRQSATLRTESVIIQAPLARYLAARLRAAPEVAVVVTCLDYASHRWNRNGSPSFCKDCGIEFPVLRARAERTAARLRAAQEETP